MVDMIATCVLLTLLGIGAVMDIRTRRIPNVVTISGLVVGMAMAALPGGVNLLQAAVSVCIAFSVAFPFFALRALGGGDVKFLMAVAAFFPPAGFWRALALIAAAGGVVALWEAFRTGAVIRTFRRLSSLLLLMVTVGRAGSRATLDTEGSLTIPYGIAIALGAAMARVIL
jgi:prepilin peptidase CpaA